MKIEGEIIGVEEGYDDVWQQSYFEGFVVETTTGEVVTIDFAFDDDHFGDVDTLDDMTNDEFIEHMKTFIGKHIVANDCFSNKFYAGCVRLK